MVSGLHGLIGEVRGIATALSNRFTTTAATVRMASNMVVAFRWSRLVLQFDAVGDVQLYDVVAAPGLSSDIADKLTELFDNKLGGDAAASAHCATKPASTKPQLLLNPLAYPRQSRWAIIDAPAQSIGRDIGYSRHPSWRGDTIPA